MRDDFRSRLANMVGMSKPTKTESSPSTRDRWYLAEWRQFRELTQEQLAERVGSSKGYISDLENSERRYNQDLLERFAKALDCKPWQLLIDPSSIPTPYPEGVDPIANAVRKLPDDQRSVALRIIEAMAKNGS
jgi:transcriptional regulator with XRE-family HTH domain